MNNRIMILLLLGAASPVLCMELHVGPSVDAYTEAQNGVTKLLEGKSVNNSLAEIFASPEWKNYVQASVDHDAEEFKKWQHLDQLQHRYNNIGEDDLNRCEEGLLHSKYDYLKSIALSHYLNAQQSTNNVQPETQNGQEQYHNALMQQYSNALLTRQNIQVKIQTSDQNSQPRVRYSLLPTRYSRAFTHSACCLIGTCVGIGLGVIMMCSEDTCRW